MRLAGMALLSVLAVCGQEPVFKTAARLVEVYATVFDDRGRFVDGLSREQFRITDEGRPQEIVAFEPYSAELSCALLLDTTGSMASALPLVKNAVVKLIERLRENDSVAVYRFSGSLALLQDFTREKALAKAAVMRTRPLGQTALFDAVSAAARDISRRQGKKAILVFTDGRDNASRLNMDSAAARARKVGVPVYAIAQGEALGDRPLMELLTRMAQSTGGRAYTVRKSSQIAGVFEDISRELAHTYLLAYVPPPADAPHWRALRVSVSGGAGYKVRAKEGYLAE